MTIRLRALSAFVGIAFAFPAFLHAQTSYAAASAERPWTLTASGGVDQADSFVYGNFPFASISLGREFGRFLRLDASTRVVRVSHDFWNSSTQTSDRMTFAQSGADATVQLQLPISFFAPYVGIGAGYYHLSQTKNSYPVNAYSDIALAGVRVAMSPRLFLAMEARANVPRLRNRGSASEVQLGGGVGVRF